MLFGAHCLLVHPFMVALAWWKLYGFPFDPRLWFAFFLHDIGYWGKPNIDGPEGKKHPLLGARIMHKLFDRKGSSRWFDFTAYHSGSLAKRHKRPVSKLWAADKLTQAITPAWLYLPMVRATGEIREYTANSPFHALCPLLAEQGTCFWCEEQWYHWLGTRALESAYGLPV